MVVNVVRSEVKGGVSRVSGVDEWVVRLSGE
jgi:hypothetical protein